MRRKGLLLGLLVAGAISIALLVYGLERTLTGGGGVRPWLYCTTNPCQPLALVPLPTPPALSHERSQAAPCDLSVPGARDGVLLWYTDWDPRTQQGRCVSREDARRLAG